MKIIIDAMGGDNAPEAVVRGTVRAVNELGIKAVLVGRMDDVSSVIDDCDATMDKIEIINADEVITMNDDPTSAVRKKKNSSMVVALNLLKDGYGDALVSAGSTGALLTGATLIVKRIKGIRRAALAPVLPVGQKGTVLIDCGANTECTPEFLLQFAFMGAYYAGKILNLSNPKVALLNNGAEEIKGGELQKQAYALLKEAAGEGRINFIGNIEGTDAFNGTADVIVCDGFTGNILLKSTEGLIRFLMNEFKGVFYKNVPNRLAASVLKNDISSLKKKLDVNEIGGTALMGISKPVIKAHGSSDESAFFAAIRQAVSYTEAGIISDIESDINSMTLNAETLE